MRRATTILIGLTLAALLVPGAESQTGQPAKRRSLLEEARKAGGRVIQGTARSQALQQGTGVIRYDPGTPTSVRFNDAGFAFLGNVFNSQSGQPLTGGTISFVSWYQGPVSGKAYQLGVVAPTSGASYIRFFVTGVAAYATNVFTFPTPLSVPSSFFVGLNASSPQSDALGTFDQIGFNTATTNSQGFHGSQRTFDGGTGSDGPITNENIAVRVNGSVAIPVELLEFEVE